MTKFVFTHTKEKVNQRPVNVLDKKPGDYDVISLEDEILSVMGQVKVDPATNTSTKPQHYSMQPKVMDLEISKLGVARSIQRPFSMNHCTGIAFDKWDSRRPLFPIVTYNTLTNEYWIVEGNHTSIAQGVRAATGFYPDFKKANWKKFKVRCQVVILEPDDNGNVDMSFCRDHFLGTNGDDRLKLDDFDLYQNYVLKVRQDYSGDVSKCDDNYAKQMFNLQKTAESWDMYPVHPRSGVNTCLPGAINHLAAFMKLSVDDVEFIGKNHKTYWDNLEVDAIELLPLSTLRKLINQHKSSAKEFSSKQHKQFMLEMATVMQRFGTTPAGFRAFAVQVWEEFYKRTALVQEKKIPQPHKDFSLVLWLKLHKKVGGSYNCIPATAYARFIEAGVDAVDCLPTTKHKLLATFK